MDSSTASQTVTADSGYTGLGTVTVNPYTYVGPARVTPTTSTQYIFAHDYNVDAIKSIIVSAVDASIDSNIAAGNIKSGVTILGVTGTYSGTINNQNKTVDPSTSQVTVTFDSGYTGLGTVTINAYTPADYDSIYNALLEI